MAYEPSAAASSQAAEISSPRESASTPQPTAPTRATAAHIARDRGESLPAGGSEPGPSPGLAAPLGFGARSVCVASGSAMILVPSLIICRAQGIYGGTTGGRKPPSV
ncbi:hypothetical protein Slala05_32470 [Streptomyces lavendulae subsp. lavendulae]|nr:hypothetical protein Slala05_32470 [Streptomyces lavendulae subsp. lavendulae]